MRACLQTFTPGQFCTTKELEQGIEFTDLGSRPWASAELCRMTLNKLADCAERGEPEIGTPGFNKGKPSDVGASTAPAGCAPVAAKTSNTRLGG